MASLSVPQLASTSSSATGTNTTRHTRKHSRNPSAVPLPSFSFNPGSQLDQDHETEEKENALVNNVPLAAHARQLSKAAPLPEFKFNPGVDIPIRRTPSPTHPILQEMERNQQRIGRSARPAPLPVFTFNPTTHGLSANSPVKSDSDTADAPKTAIGHKRGGSEFIGGSSEGGQLLATSPQKSESRPHIPSAVAHGPRGHMHRRSQAISISDIDTSDLIKSHALALSRAGSNPPTPSENQTFPLAHGSPANKFSMNGSRSTPASPKRRESAPGVRQRVVDFSEKVDVIPRPLSMISSETERSNSTFHGHSLSNSINSIASPVPLSPLQEPRLLMTIDSEVCDPRPNTADANSTLYKCAGNTEDYVLTLPKRPLSASNSPMVSSSGSPPAKKKHFWSNHMDDDSPTPTPSMEKSNPLADHSPSVLAHDFERIRPQTAPCRPSTMKKHKYHTWTAGIFSKRIKHHSTSEEIRSSPRPANLVRRDSDLVDQIFDGDDTVVLREESPVTVRKSIVSDPSLLSSPVNMPPLADSHSPVIDLDAALGSETTGDLSRSTTSRIAKLHSSERRGITDAFGVIHRRTESAPAMPAVNRALFGLGRHGSAISLGEDVFDEEEEDDFLARQGKDKLELESVSLGPRTHDAFPSTENGLGLTNMPSPVDGVVIVDPESDFSNHDGRSANMRLATSIPMEDIPKRPATSPMSFSYCETQVPYASSTEARTTTASLISSPDADHITFDTRTKFQQAMSPNTDTLRPSTDDSPSLSDSSSIGVATGQPAGSNVRPLLEQRSHSMIVSGTSKDHQSWKRSSMASLNRLIPGSSHGSRLKFETPTPSINEGKTPKKANRLSRLMRFWRARESGDEAAA